MVRRRRVVVIGHYLNIFFLKTIGPIELLFHTEPLHDMGTKVYIFSPGHMTKMSTMTRYNKKFKNLFLRNHWADCLEVWFVVSWTTSSTKSCALRQGQI